MASKGREIPPPPAPPGKSDTCSHSASTRDTLPWMVSPPQCEIEGKVAGLGLEEELEEVERIASREVCRVQSSEASTAVRASA